MIALIILAFGLAGCSGSKEDDLDRWMKERRTQVKGKIPPLPEIKKYVPFIYNADGSLHDPFKSRQATDNKVPGGLHPDFSRPKEPLEAFPLENLKFVGYLEQGKKGVGLIAAPDNTVYQVRVGNYLGQNYGLVTKISQDEITVKEMVQEPTGEYVERRVTINPQE
jgi:type IV pilus assembly protein PilP